MVDLPHSGGIRTKFAIRLRALVRTQIVYKFEPDSQEICLEITATIMCYGNSSFKEPTAFCVWTTFVRFNDVLCFSKY